jgi:hypothetical protein
MPSFTAADYGGNQTLTQDGVQALLRDIRSTAGRKNPQVLGINIHNQMLAKNNGFPHFLYPPIDSTGLYPVQVLRQEEEDELSKRGYTREYKHRDWPKMIYRRNMNARFAGLLDNGDPDPAAHAFTEARPCESEKQFQTLNKSPRPPQAGPWVMDIAALEPLPDADGEDPAITISRLEGQLQEARSKSVKG